MIKVLLLLPLALLVSCTWLHSPGVQDPLRNLHNARMAIEAVPGAKAAADSISPWVSVGRLGLNMGWVLAELVTGVGETRPPEPSVGTYSGLKPSLGAFSVAPANDLGHSLMTPTAVPTPIGDTSTPVDTGRLHSSVTPVGYVITPTPFGTVTPATVVYRYSLTPTVTPTDVIMSPVPTLGSAGPI